MACTNCKQKNIIKEELKKQPKSFDMWVTVWIISWTLLGFYGLYSLITKLF